jgi:hypothetical protein
MTKSERIAWYKALLAKSMHGWLTAVDSRVVTNLVTIYGREIFSHGRINSGPEKPKLIVKCSLEQRWYWSAIED